jgi:predicted DCC family thiol-disulfide oxidoreductase YuxK
MADDQAIVLYDGVCGLCNRVTQFILPRDRKNRFLFAALQSETGRAILQRHHRPVEVLDTFYVVLDHQGDHERLIARGRAALYIARALGFPWSWFSLARILPDAILDPLYDFVARRRYAWFGKLEACAIPKPEHKSRFIA